MLPEIVALKSNVAGPTTIVMAGVHGNEMSGVIALETLKTLKPLCGEILLINAHPGAQKLRKRYVEKDLNRCFGQKKQGAVECKIATYIEPFLQSSDYVLDIHNTTGKDSQPFLISEHPQLNSLFDVEIVLSGLDALHPGGSDGYTNSLGKVGLCLEAGSISDDLAQTSAFAYDVSLNFLTGIGQIAGKPLQYEDQTRISCTSIYKTTSDYFRLAKSYADFENIAAGQLLACDAEHDVYSQEDGVILFAYEPSCSGKEGFVLGKKLD